MQDATSSSLHPCPCHCFQLAAGHGPTTHNSLKVPSSRAGGKADSAVPGVELSSGEGEAGTGAGRGSERGNHGNQGQFTFNSTTSNVVAIHLVLNSVLLIGC